MDRSTFKDLRGRYRAARRRGAAGFMPTLSSQYRAGKSGESAREVAADVLRGLSPRESSAVQAQPRDKPPRMIRLLPWTTRQRLKWLHLQIRIHTRLHFQPLRNNQ